MDNVTHALAGLLMADVTVQAIGRRGGAPVTPRLRRIVVLLGVAAAEWPDSDLLYSGPLAGMGPLGYLLHHRGHTHTLLWAAIGAIGLWWLARRQLRRGAPEGAGAVDGPLLTLAVAGSWSHLLLDWTNSYGVHPFWPLDNRWYYGDAVFIVEPWLWFVAIPPLLLGARSRGGRVVLAGLAAVMALATLFSGEVARGAAVGLLVAALCWGAFQWYLRPGRRVWAGIAAWVAVTLGFIGTSRAVRAEVFRSAPATTELLDAVLSPAPADPRCWSVLAVLRTADSSYQLHGGIAAPFGWYPAARCLEAAAGGRGGVDLLGGLAGTQVLGTDAVGAAATDRRRERVLWRSRWRAPVTALRALAASNCEVAAALRFMRTPVWQPAADGRLLLADARYGVGGGFNTLVLPPRGACPLAGRWVPDWVPPRAELLRAAAPTERPSR